MSDIWNNDSQSPEDEVMHEMESGGEHVAPQYAYLNEEVVQRFERAKLYSTLLNHQLFGEGSADPAIVESVEAEIKAFVVGRIETMMGLRNSQSESVNSNFSPEEVDALKLLASRMIAKSRVSESQEPTLQTPPPAQQEPTIRMVQARPRPPAAQPSRTVTVGAPPAKKAQRKRKSANVGAVSGQDLSQAGNPNALPMPSQDEINNIVANQAHSVMNKGKAMMGEGGGPGGLDLGTLVKAVSRNVKMEE